MRYTTSKTLSYEIDPTYLWTYPSSVYFPSLPQYIITLTSPIMPFWCKVKCTQSTLSPKFRLHVAHDISHELRDDVKSERNGIEREGEKNSKIEERKKQMVGARKGRVTSNHSIRAQNRKLF